VNSEHTQKKQSSGGGYKIVKFETEGSTMHALSGGISPTRESIPLKCLCRKSNPYHIEKQNPHIKKVDFIDNNLDKVL
jgi:hypothetical protein